MFSSRVFMFCCILSFFLLVSAVESIPTIVVDVNGGGKFTKIQDAIDSVPSQNKDWICIFIKQGIYREKITIPFDKPFIYLKGQNKRNTRVVWGASDATDTSATFTSQADNVVANCITFVNSYNTDGSGRPVKVAVAALIQGDKSFFNKCGFIGVQDTLWDHHGRHYFKHCTIEGAIDFIFGGGQSLYEGCTISVVSGGGYITAQGRENPSDSNGFVFNDCKIVGKGPTYLGRPWRGYARVLFYNTKMSDIIAPEGWNPWRSAGHENLLTLAEEGCSGPGADTSQRVPWANQIKTEELQQLISKSFIDSEGWTTKLQFVSN